MRKNIQEFPDNLTIHMETQGNTAGVQVEWDKAATSALDCTPNVWIQKKGTRRVVNPGH